MSDVMTGVAVPFDGAAEAASRPLREPARHAHAGSLLRALEPLRYVAHEQWAWEQFRPVLLAYAAERGAALAAAGAGRAVRLLEIGGGRDPLFGPAEAAVHGFEVTVNDIDPEELALAPEGLGRAAFDIAGPPAALAAHLGRYDLVFSHMVFEHVADVPAAWANARALLAPGGVALAFYPTLFAPPFVVNHLVPEALSRRLLAYFFPHRTRTVQPKFPAHYDRCRGDGHRLAPMFAAAGFREHLVLPFWTHGYFRSIPGLREADNALQALARRRDWRWLTSYAYAIARR